MVEEAWWVGVFGSIKHSLNHWLVHQTLSHAFFVSHFIVGTNDGHIFCHGSIKCISRHVEGVYGVE